MAQHLPAWSDLVARCLEHSVFNEPAFALPAAQLLGIGARLQFLVVRDTSERVGSRLLGLCCIAADPFGLSASAWMHAQSTAGFPLLDRDDAPDALAAMLAHLAAGRVRPCALLVQGVPAEGPTARLLNEHRSWRTVLLDKRTRAVLTADEAASSKPHQPSKEMRRQRRRLADRGEVCVRSARTTEEVTHALDRFLALESSGWKGRRRTALAQSRPLRAFTQRMTRTLAASGQCRIDSLELDGRMIAAGIVLRSGDRAYFWKTTYDEALRSLSPGVQITSAITDHQRSELGLEFTDSCAVPQHAMIDRLWTDRIEVVDVLVGDRRMRPALFDLAIRLETMRRTLKQSARRGIRHLRRLRTRVIGR